MSARFALSGERGTQLTAFEADCVAYTVKGRSLQRLGHCRSHSAWLAMVWPVQRVGHIADQLDQPAAAPVRAWMSDGWEHARALLRLGQQETYAYTICDGDVRYVLAVAPPPLSSYTAMLTRGSHASQPDESPRVRRSAGLVVRVRRVPHVGRR